MSPGKQGRGTKWGKLILVENPTKPVTQGFKGPVCDKVPRTINLQGKITYIGRGKKSPIGGATQTTIDLGYISSGHCCLSLRRKDGGGIEAVVKDTSSNGTYVDATRVPKGSTRALTAENQVALYYPMGATALGRPILYDLELYEQEFENVKMRQEAVAKATRELEADRERMANDARSLRSQLEVAVSRNKQLAADRNALQEELASAASTRKQHEKRAHQQQEQLKKTEAALSGSEASMAELVEGARRDREKAAAAERGEAEAKKDGERKEKELREQIDALIERQLQDQQKLAEIAAESKSWSSKFEDGQLKAAETQANVFSLTAQLKDAQEAVESCRAKLAEEEAASAEAKRARAEAEGELARNKNQLEAAETGRKSLQGCADEVKLLSAELQERKATSSRTSKGLEQALSDLEEERVAKRRVAEELSKLEGEVGVLRSEEKRVKNLLEEAAASGTAAKADLSRVTVELEESQKTTRALQAEEARLDLEVSKNRRDGVKGEARFIGTNLKKAKQKALVLNKELMELMQYLDVPVGNMLADSQGAPSLGDPTVDDAIANGGCGSHGSPDPNGNASGHGLRPADGNNSGADSPARSLGNEMDEVERLDATQGNGPSSGATDAEGEGTANGGSCEEDGGVAPDAGAGGGDADEQDDDEDTDEEMHNTQGDEERGSEEAPKARAQPNGTAEVCADEDQTAGRDDGGDSTRDEGNENDEEQGQLLLEVSLSGPAAAAPHGAVRLDQGFGDEDETEFTVPPLDFGRGTRGGPAEGVDQAGGGGGTLVSAAPREDNGVAEQETELLTVSELEQQMSKLEDAAPVGKEQDGGKKRPRDEGPDVGVEERPLSSERDNLGAPADKKARVQGGGDGAICTCLCFDVLRWINHGEEGSSDDREDQNQRHARSGSYAVDQLADIAAAHHSSMASVAGAGAGDGGLLGDGEGASASEVRRIPRGDGGGDDDAGREMGADAGGSEEEGVAGEEEKFAPDVDDDDSDETSDEKGY
ncbi:conserved unknown protein [Ectocarpus siliculosus]|uniref:FHA domain-containing protein n=1 Tax=Ectocarpus siliculosus TaxID=2880 RepID=D8LGV9_ECTSI|nr:conserved unknown protein [Ectocarpus siliculosus]|eukprot:CBN75812.1 conserved unknown protein [Ectocarpus siliculosus]